MFLFRINMCHRQAATLLRHCQHQLDQERDEMPTLAKKVCVVSVNERGKIFFSFSSEKPRKTIETENRFSKRPKNCGNIIKLICANFNANWRWQLLWGRWEGMGSIDCCKCTNVDIKKAHKGNFHRKKENFWHCFWKIFVVSLILWLSVLEIFATIFECWRGDFDGIYV